MKIKLKPTKVEIFFSSEVDQYIVRFVNQEDPLHKNITIFKDGNMIDRVSSTRAPTVHNAKRLIINYEKLQS